ncbi:MAG: DUF5642 family protein [Mycobacterium sp.]
MRRLVVGLVVVVLAAGCAQPAGPVASPSKAAEESPAGARPVDPTRIKRVRGDLPPGYEVADVDAAASIAGFWGFKPGWAAEPPQCAALVDPVGGPRSAQGLSGSGPGGIIYVVVATAPSGPVALDPALLADCGQWTMSFGRSAATVSLVDAPRVEGADTVGMATAIRTVVESGTETDAQAQTFSSYLGEHFVFVTLVTDPGSPDPPLPPGFAADLLVKAVSALRG